MVNQYSWSYAQPSYDFPRDAPCREYVAEAACSLHRESWLDSWWPSRGSCYHPKYLYIDCSPLSTWLPIMAEIAPEYSSSLADKLSGTNTRAIPKFSFKHIKDNASHSDPSGTGQNKNSFIETLWPSIAPATSGGNHGRGRGISRKRMHLHN